MKIYKIADGRGEIRNNILSSIFDNMQGRRYSPMGLIVSDSVEKMVEDIQGTAYVSVSYSEFEDEIVIEKYYESEYMNDEYGRVYKVKMNYDNPQETINKVNKLIGELS